MVKKYVKSNVIQACVCVWWGGGGGGEQSSFPQIRIMTCHFQNLFH